MKHLAAAIFVLLLVLAAQAGVARDRCLKPFTVAGEIGLGSFLQPLDAETTFVSPDGHFVALQPVERGLLKRGLVEDELRVYEVAKLRTALVGRDQVRPPLPVLDVRESTYRDGPIISEIQWLPDSSGVAFLLKTAQGGSTLMVVGLRGGRPEALSLPGQDVTAFDVRDRTHYVYTVFAPSSISVPGETWTILVGTGNTLFDLMNPLEWRSKIESGASENGLRSVLWAAVGGAPHLMISRRSNEPILINPLGRWLALAPDGHSLVTAITVTSVPERWVRSFRPPSRDDPQQMHAGRQDVNTTISAGSLVSEYVLINLRTRAITAVNGAPTGIGNGWWGEIGVPKWSEDGKAVLLPNTYPMPSTAHQFVARPCAAIFYPVGWTMQCLRDLSPHDIARIGSLQFVDGNSDEVAIHFLRGGGERSAPREEVYVHARDGIWRVVGGRAVSQPRSNGIDVYVRQGLNTPPVVVATDRRSKISRVIWDPNPQLKNIALGEAVVYQWKDSTGRKWTAGLYKPINYVPGRRYPLVIQTHGFPRDQFQPSGIYPTAFAARALAASGMFVLQVPMECVFEGTREGLCNVEGFVSAVAQLSAQGLVDRNRVGIIGFSRTTYYVLEALTTAGATFAAASVTDGEDYGYMQYLSFLDYAKNVEAHVAEAVIGARPFGTGIQVWIKQSPEFNMMKVSAPLLVTSLGRLSLLDMWESYAVLRYLNKPVDLLVLNSDEHVLTDPAIRMASQGGSVDWFRFWLQGYEDPDAAKAPEYRRWEKLCDLQITQNPRIPTFCVSSRK